MKIKVFVSAYACEPGLGSEIGVGWHWVLEMSKYFDLWVLTRESNRHTIESWIKEHPEYAHIRFIYFDLPRWARFWKKGLRGVRLYYNLWQRYGNKTIKRTMQENGIEVFHLLTYGNFLWPVSQYGQKQFFIWGPGSAGNTVPKEFSRKYAFKSRVKESLQRFIRKTLRYNRRFKKQCGNADLILCKTNDTHTCIPAKDSAKAIVFTDVAVEIHGISGPDRGGRSARKQLKYLAVGALEGWRGFDILIEAFASALKTYPDMRLEILGRGNERKNLKSLIERLDVKDRVSLTGQVSTDAYYTKMTDADVIVNPCLREGGVTAAFDAMSLGKPFLCIETGGYTRYFNPDNAVVIDLSTRQETIESMVKGIIELTDAGVRESIGIKAKESALQYSWEQKGRLIYETIYTAYSAWTKQNPKR